MHKRILAPLFLTGCIFLAACAGPTPPPTATDSPSATPLPTETQPAVPTDTPVPQMTDTPDIFAELNPASAPLKEWNGIPIMPGALAGDGSQTTYYFTTKSTVDEIHAFYDQSLAKVGLVPLAVGNGKENTLVLFYQSSDQSSDAGLSITLFIKADTVLVMMVKN